MSQSLTIQIANVVAQANKAGKVTTSAANAARLLNSADKATVIAAAMDGRGQVGKAAKAAIAQVAPTLDHYCTLDTLNGREWGAVTVAISQELNVVPDTLKPTAPERVAQMLDYAEAMQAAKLAKCGGVFADEKAQTRFSRMQNKIDGLRGHLTRWAESRRLEIEAAEAAKAQEAVTA